MILVDVNLLVYVVNEDSPFHAKAISDAHFAALAIEHDCELCSTDGDFAKFSGLRWRNPLEPTSTAGS